MRWFRPWIILLAISLAAPKVLAGQPNIVIVLADDMGYGDIQHLNPHSRIPTPHLDQLAQQGITFRDAHSASAVCTPTRYSLLTGRYSWRTPMKSGVLGGYSQPMLEPGRATLASLLKRSGYRTAAIGKWHLGMDLPLRKPDADLRAWQGDPGIDFAGVIGDSPIHHGFDEFFGVSASLDMAPYVFIRNDRFTALPTRQQAAQPFPHFIRPGPQAEDFVIEQVLDRLVQEATQFIERQNEQPQPWFLYVPLTAPHKPTQPHPRFRGTTGLGDYGDFIAQVDDAVGQIVEAVDGHDQRHNTSTLLVFTSDNGSYMKRFDVPQPDHTDDASIQGYRHTTHTANGPWRGTKADIYEGGHHVPFFARWPGHFVAGSTVDATICQVDLFATCAEIVQQPLPDNEAEDSFSLLSLARGEVATRPAAVIHQSAAGMLALRQGNWKLIAGNGSGGRQPPIGKPLQTPFQLYDLQADPAESQDVSAQNPQITSQLTATLQRLQNASGSRQAMAADPER